MHCGDETAGGSRETCQIGSILRLPNRKVGGTDGRIKVSIPLHLQSAASCGAETALPSEKILAIDVQVSIEVSRKVRGQLVQAILNPVESRVD